MMYSTSSDIQNLAMSSRSRRIARSTTGSTIWTTICHFYRSLSYQLRLLKFFHNSLNFKPKWRLNN